MLALIKNNAFARLIPETGWVELTGNDRVSPPTVGWHGTSGEDTYAILAYKPVAVPEGKQRVGEPSYDITSGECIETYSVDDYAQPIPQSITPAQAKATLYDAGLLDAAEALVAEHPYPLVRIYWQSALQFERDNAYIAALAYELGVDGNLDELFRAAGERVF